MTTCESIFTRDGKEIVCHKKGEAHLIYDPNDAGTEDEWGMPKICSDHWIEYVLWLTIHLTRGRQPIIPIY